jgi:hypothetical protein
MEPESPPPVASPQPSALPAVRIGDQDREAAAAVLERACGEGLLNLEEFSARVGAVWAADTVEQLRQATADLAQPVVGGIREPEEKIVAVFGENKRSMRWRLPGLLRVLAVFGSCELDLREAAVGADAMRDHLVRITGRCVFGELKVTVPEGVDVELRGRTVFGSRSMNLAPVARLAGTPLVVVDVDAVFAEVTVRSKGPSKPSVVTLWPGKALDS